MRINFAVQSLKPEELQKSKFTAKLTDTNPQLFDGLFTSVEFWTNCLLYKGSGITIRCQFFHLTHLI